MKEFITKYFIFLAVSFWLKGLVFVLRDYRLRLIFYMMLDCRKGIQPAKSAKPICVQGLKPTTSPTPGE